MRIARTELYAGRMLLLGLMAITILPFISIFVTALHPSGTLLEDRTVLTKEPFGLG